MDWETNASYWPWTPIERSWKSSTRKGLRPWSATSAFSCPAEKKPTRPPPASVALLDKDKHVLWKAP